jgi:hypothetical protein
MYIITDNEDVEYGTFKTEDEAYKAITEAIKKRNFKSYYYRQVILEDGRVWIDYGSHHHFFYIQTIK